MFLEERSRVVEAAQSVMSRGVLSHSLHGNVSYRIPDTDYICMTGSSLASLDADKLAVVTADGEVVWGSLAPTEREVLDMHTSFYKERAECRAVIHTHSPYATAFAVAGRPLPLVSESLARWGIVEEVPVAAWGPRGSVESVGHIRSTLTKNPDSPAVLLASHGILVSGTELTEAVRRVIAIEENAILAAIASGLGGPLILNASQAKSSSSRRLAFAAEGNSTT